MASIVLLVHAKDDSADDLCAVENFNSYDSGEFKNSPLSCYSAKTPSFL